MRIENFRWLAAIIAAHPNRELTGRTRLQKEVKLLQRLNFPTDYSFKSYFYGPYSEGVQSDIGLLEKLGLIKEIPGTRRDSRPYYVFKAEDNAVLDEMSVFQRYIDIFEDTETDVLELAATYDSYRELGLDHKEALKSLRRKKGEKCGGGNERAALELLRKLELSH